MNKTLKSPLCLFQFQKKAHRLAGLTPIGKKVNYDYKKPIGALREVRKGNRGKEAPNNLIQIKEVPWQ